MIRRTSIFAVLFFLVAVAFAPSATADQGMVLATAEAEDETDVVEEPATDVTPAVEAEEAAEDEDDQPWTSRFLVPTVLAMGALGVVAAFGYYVVRVRGRYRVV